MAKKKKEKVVEETTQETKVNEPKGDVTEVQEKMKMKPIVEEQTVTKVNLDESLKTEENTDTEQEVVEEVLPEQDTAQDEDVPIVEEITNEEQVEETVEEVITKSIETGVELPENIQKLVNFMDETGGDLNDYITLNQDYSELDNHTLLKEYYKTTKPHLSEEEIDFVMEDEFAYDEDVDEDKQIKRKKLAMKEQVAQAKLHLESVKSKYYEDIKMGSKLTSEQQNAIEFFNKHNEESERNRVIGEKQSEVFRMKSDQVFGDNFKGFEYNVGDKRFRFNIKDKQNVRETQGDINNFIKKFLTEDNMIDDARGYHKGLFTAMNPDQVANHFYEQGKADALKDSIAKSKNVNMDPRQAHVENVNTSGFSARVLNDDGPDFKFKIKNK
jgi:hypothetical protein